MTAQDLTATPGRDLSLLKRLPRSVLATLTPGQQAAISRAAPDARLHPVDLRLTLPIPGRPVFLALVAGREQRSRERRELERRHHPLHTVGNILFLICGLAGFYALALFAALLAGSILSF